MKWWRDLPAMRNKMVEGFANARNEMAEGFANARKEKWDAKSLAVRREISDLRKEMGESRADNIKWMFIFLGGASWRNRNIPIRITR